MLKSVIIFGIKFDKLITEFCLKNLSVECLFIKVVGDRASF